MSKQIQKYQKQLQTPPLPFCLHLHLDLHLHPNLSHPVQLLHPPKNVEMNAKVLNTATDSTIAILSPCASGSPSTSKFVACSKLLHYLLDILHKLILSSIELDMIQSLIQLQLLVHVQVN